MYSVIIDVEPEANAAKQNLRLQFTGTLPFVPVTGMWLEVDTGSQYRMITLGLVSWKINKEGGHFFVNGSSDFDEDDKEGVEKFISLFTEFGWKVEKTSE